jgi:hypothetical protein
VKSMGVSQFLIRANSRPFAAIRVERGKRESLRMGRE